MATTIKLKNSVTTTNAPSSLAQGEVAINVTDKKVWVGNAATTPVQLLGTGSDGSFTNLTVSGTTALNGGATLGDASGDALTINSSAVSIPNGLNFDSNTFVIDATNNRVGVGTASPSQKIHVSDSAATYLQLSNTSGTPSNIFIGALGSNNSIISRDGTTGNNPLAFIVGTTERMRIDSLGQLGIGTSSPGYRLDVAAGDTTAGLGYAARLRSNSTAGAASLQFTNNAVSAQNAYITADDSQNLTLASGTGYARLWTNGSERMRIDSSGNVGIGTSSPANPGSFGCVLNIDNAGGSALYLSDDGSVGQVSMFGTSMSINNRANGATLFSTNATERMRIDSSGNVGIGTSSPQNQLHINGTSTGYARFQSSNRTFTIGSLASAYGFVINDVDAAAERMRIDASGNVGIGITTPNTRLVVYANTTTATQRIFNVNAVNTYQMSFHNSVGECGTITTGSNSVGYNSNSDYRLKENIAPMTGALAKVSALKPVTYKWKSDGSDGQGFIAHELQEVCPEAVTGEKDAVDEEGNPQYQGIDTSFLVATLTAAIQELKAEVDALKAQINQ